MYIKLNDVDTGIIKSAASTLNKDADEYTEIIKGDELIEVSKIIELIDDLNYELGRLEEKIEEMEK